MTIGRGRRFSFQASWRETAALSNMKSQCVSSFFNTSDSSTTNVDDKKKGQDQYWPSYSNDNRMTKTNWRNDVFTFAKMMISGTKFIDYPQRTYLSTSNRIEKDFVSILSRRRNVKGKEKALDRDVLHPTLFPNAVEWLGKMINIEGRDESIKKRRKFNHGESFSFECHVGLVFIFEIFKIKHAYFEPSVTSKVN